jgi:flagellar biosynthesis protein
MDKAVAVEYTGDLPQIVASARGRMAEKLVRMAADCGITVVENPDLAGVLSVMKAGESIPVEMFRAVSEVLAYCYRVNDKFREKMAERGL